MCTHRRDEASEEPRLSRRSLIERGVAAAALIALPRLAGASPPDANGGASSSRRMVARPYLDAALRAERWIARSAIRDSRGTSWPADPLDPKSVQTNLYSGTPGIVLFYLELYGATHDERWLKEARGGADYLVATLPGDAASMGEEGAGLYTGVAGIGHTLALVSRATRDARYEAAARRAFALLADGAKANEGGVAWNSSSDIISGSGGIALALLWASRELGDASLRDLAVRGARHLATVGQAEHGGLKWAISDDVPRRYPNFSHGTAGAAYVLATLYGVSQERALLDASLAGERYLASIATTTPNGGLRVFHSEPGGEQLFYLSWCHGPAGTARLYERLARVTHDARWSAYVPRLARGIVDSGVPEQHPDRSGYWNNISQCCGNCGVSEFFLDLHAATKEKAHLDYATRVVDDTLARATSDGDGLKWIQAEHRIKPELLVAQTGLMQGASGVGLALLHLDGALAGRKRIVVLPDNPWG